MAASHHYKYGKTALGIFVDGMDLKFARLSISGKKVVLRNLGAVALISELGEPVGKKSKPLMDVEDPFQLESTSPDQGEILKQEASESENNNSVMINLFSRFPARKNLVALTVSEPHLFYHSVESDFGLRGEKLKTRLIKEIAKQFPQTNIELTSEMLDTISTADDNLLCMALRDGIPLLELIQGIRPYIGGRLPRIPFVESSDIALVNFVRANFDLPQNGITVIVYIGAQYSRLIFMRGLDYLHMAPLISEGLNSRTIQNTIYSRILLEQDTSSIGKIDNIMLAGACYHLSLKESLELHFKDVSVEYLQSSSLDMTQVSPEQANLVSEYAIPIATAWRALAEDKQFYDINLLPSRVREGQKVLKLAWHGYAMLLLLFGVTVFFTWQYGLHVNKIESLRTALEFTSREVNEQTRLMEAVDSLRGSYVGYENAVAVTDSLVVGTDKWSRQIEKLTGYISDVQSLWITSVKTSGDGMSISGYALYRSRIPSLAKLLGNAKVTQVLVQKIRGETVYRFEMEARVKEEIPEIVRGLIQKAAMRQSMPVDSSTVPRAEKKLASQDIFSHRSNN